MFTYIISLSLHDHPGEARQIGLIIFIYKNLIFQFINPYWRRNVLPPQDVTSLLQ